MSFLENFIKSYDKDHYKRYPKAKIVVRVFYAISIVVIILLIIRAVRMTTNL
jgi:hypothetical protein